MTSPSDTDETLMSTITDRDCNWEGWVSAAVKYPASAGVVFVGKLSPTGWETLSLPHSSSQCRFHYETEGVFVMSPVRSDVSTARALLRRGRRLWGFCSGAREGAREGGAPTTDGWRGAKLVISDRWRPSKVLKFLQVLTGGLSRLNEGERWPAKANFTWVGCTGQR